MFESACVVGAGRVGRAMATRLGGRIPTRTTGRELDCAQAELVLLCVPDRAIPEVAAAVAPGPWLAHTSGASRLEALAPHERRFSLHPLQTFTLDRGPEQLDGAWAAISPTFSGSGLSSWTTRLVLSTTRQRASGRPSLSPSTTSRPG